MNMYVCNIEPVSKARPRTVTRNGRVWTFTPNKTRDTESLIKLDAKQHFSEPFEAHIPLKLKAIFYRKKPESYSLKKEDRPVRKPDLDNFVKLLVDALVPDIIPDDAQLTTLIVCKRWTKNDTGYIYYGIEIDDNE